MDVVQGPEMWRLTSHGVGDPAPGDHIHHELLSPAAIAAVQTLVWVAHLHLLLFRIDIVADDPEAQDGLDAVPVSEW